MKRAKHSSKGKALPTQKAAQSSTQPSPAKQPPVSANSATSAMPADAPAKAKANVAIIIAILIGLLILLIAVLIWHPNEDNSHGLASSFTLQSSSARVSQGDTVRVDVTAKNVQDLAGTQFTLNYDPSILQYKSMTQGPFLANDGAQSFMLGTADAATPGQVKDIVVVRIGPGASGSGVVASVYFTAIQKGKSTLSASPVRLSNSQAQPISIGTVGTTVSVR